MDKNLIWDISKCLDELRTKLDRKVEKCVFIGYSLEQKGYKCYNPIMCQFQVRRDVVFDEMASWYADVKHDIGADVKENVVTERASPSSQVLRGPQGSLCQKARMLLAANGCTK